MATISICAKILSTIPSPAFEKAYEKGLSIWEAKNELNKLRVTVKTIKTVLNDAENKQEGSDAIKNWIQRLKGVLYDAEDLFDEVLTEDLLKQQMMGGMNKLSLKNKVWVSCSKLNPVVSRNSIANKVKAIRERLAEISTDMNQFKFVQGEPIVNTRRENYGARCSIDPKFVIGRDLDKDSILKILFNEFSDPLAVIAIVGIGGMGKTTLAHLIYNDEKVKDFFEKKCFACISDSSDDKEVLGKIYQSISEENCSGLNLMQLEDKIRKSLKDKKYLLVLDDVWEEDHGKWTSRKNLLNSGANGSVIVVTTRLQSVVSVVGAVSAHNLKGLSEDDSWDLFKKLAFVSGYENDPRRESLGRELLKRCRGLPLAIWCMGELLFNKTIREWEEIERVGLPMLRGKHNDEVISILKLSYDHLPSNLKQCFTYCCLFPKDYRYMKEKLVYHWIALGYINFDEEESSFMYLLRMGFFQEVEQDEYGEIKSCKMHDIMHDLALYLSGEESIVQNGTALNVGSCIRYVSLVVDSADGGLWDIPTPLLNSKSIRSCMLRRALLRDIQPNLDQLCSHFKLLRILILSGLGIKHIPSSIGELKLVRYLDLSWNSFERLPDSIANLVNLLILDLSGCENLNAWPLNFKNLIKLETLKLSRNVRLSSMPEGIEGMVSLQNLSVFVVEKWSRLHESTEFLKRLKGRLFIKFYREMEAGDELRWQIPSAASLRHLEISDCPSHGIWGWGNNESTMRLESLKLRSCKNVKYLPPMSSLPCLKWLVVEDMPELEYIEESEEVNPRKPATSQIFFPSLEKLKLLKMEKLKGWRKEVAAEATSTSSTSGASAFLEFSQLRELSIMHCPNFEFESFPKCPDLRNLQLHKVTMPSAIFCSSNWSSLEEIELSECESPSGILGEGLTFVRRLVIQKDSSFKSLRCQSGGADWHKIRGIAVEINPLLSEPDSTAAGQPSSSSQILTDSTPVNTSVSDATAACQPRSNSQVVTDPTATSHPSTRIEEANGHQTTSSNLRRAPVNMSEPDSTAAGQPSSKSQVVTDSKPTDMIEPNPTPTSHSSTGIETPKGRKITSPELRRAECKGITFKSVHATLYSIKFSVMFIHIVIDSLSEGGSESASTIEGHLATGHPSTKVETANEHKTTFSNLRRVNTSESDSTPACQQSSRSQIANTIEERIRNRRLPPPPPLPQKLDVKKDPSELQDTDVLKEVSVVEESEDPCSIFLLLPEDYEIEKDKLIQLWMAGEWINDEQHGDELFSSFFQTGYLSHCSSNLKTGKARYKIVAQKIKALRDRQKGNAESIQHVSLGCNAEIDAKTFKAIEMFTQLRTLLFLGNCDHGAIQIPRHLFSVFNHLATLDLSGTRMKELPSSIEHIRGLRFLDLSWTLIEWLPDILCTLVQLQTLKLRGCYNLTVLPENLHQLTKLRHLDFDVLGQLETMPPKMGELVDLRTLPAFLVGTGDGRKITELNKVNSLSGELCIANLENTENGDEAKAAALTYKEHLKTLELRWTSSEICGMHDNNEVILEKLEPSKKLEELKITCYEGESFPCWIGDPDFGNLTSIVLYRCENLSYVPVVEQLPNLKHLRLVRMNGVKEIVNEQEQRNYVAFPNLEKLEIDEMQSLENWDWKNSNEGDFSSLSHLIIEDCPELARFDVVSHLPSIRHFEIRNCPKLETLSDRKLPDSLEELIVDDCPPLQQRLVEGGEDWHKIEHVPNKSISEVDEDEWITDTSE